jgi:hypothetical protein
VLAVISVWRFSSLHLLEMAGQRPDTGRTSVESTQQP